MRRRKPKDGDGGAVIRRSRRSGVRHFTAPALLCLLAGCPASATSDAGSTTFGCPVPCTSSLTCKNERCVPIRCGGAGLGVGGPGCSEGQVCIDHYCSEVGCDPACPQGQSCSAQTCVPALPPSCQTNSDCDTGESCVGGFCSQTGCTPSCASKDVCLDGLCVPPGSGQSACAKPYQPCQNGDGLYCANLLTDSTNCGACGTTCPTGEVCNGSGVCAVTCIPSETKCQGSGGALCVNVQSDNQNCGQCGQACPAGQSCSAGACAATCAVPFATCGPASSIYCADLASDPSNCGGCGKACPAGGSCLDGGCAVFCPAPFVLCSSNGGSPCVNPDPLTGVCPSGGGYGCVDLSFDVANCGSCGNNCGASSVCFSGSCAPCGGAQQLCCPGGHCNAGATCNNGICSGSSSSGGSACGTCLVLSPGSLNFGQIGQSPSTTAWCSSLPKAVTLTNACSSPITVSSFGDSNPSFVTSGALAAPFTIPAGGTPVAFEVTFEPTAAGVQTGAVSAVLVGCPNTYTTSLTADAEAGVPNTDGFTLSGGSELIFPLTEMPGGRDHCDGKRDRDLPVRRATLRGASSHHGSRLRCSSRLDLRRHEQLHRLRDRADLG